ncbi:GNAT family N-acetyltransferase [Seongchinamella sediminis]|uniref:GNAT family N-acetyltransferase n=1 Tax=Seongchinamella sediminis TaxID=2283635 RepID=A0A3L7E381_9GAMM|nr:arsinothricin resistance N-acetyltransferase ArsN1 family B [Seongchinamella sediminis]RLQ22893.1 GNAT family N-acetyltransferase [Seongchinamella sediminis]
MIRAAQPSDSEQLAAIYNHYIRHSLATFEEQELDSGAMRERMQRVAELGYPWLVAEEGGAICGYAYATRWRERSAYRFSVESTVYLAPAAGGRGWGTQLYSALFDELKELGVHAVIGGITLPNPASVALHEKMGMRKVAEFPQVGFKQGQWLDVGYWQRNF